ncbi:hypothetical protein PoB_004597500 [Plakobranchus ocellatus]|uniref:Secreted protein n=1 Tax=Plakobranchus ocellatus TaxID=259542 RepID=A0AAV4BK95_9GAST|nr:hypothetical protein PoB_004597500 [Plakobranchus ocellatus]
MLTFHVLSSFYVYFHSKLCYTRPASCFARQRSVGLCVGHEMAPPFPLSDRATDVRPGCKTQRISPTFRQVADLVCARTKESEYFKTCIVGHVNCCLQCGPTLTVRYRPTS